MRCDASEYTFNTRRTLREAEQLRERETGHGGVRVHQRFVNRVSLVYLRRFGDPEESRGCLVYRKDDLVGVFTPEPDSRLVTTYFTSDEANIARYLAGETHGFWFRGAFNESLLTTAAREQRMTTVSMALVRDVSHQPSFIVFAGAQDSLAVYRVSDLISPPEGMVPLPVNAWRRPDHHYAPDGRYVRRAATSGQGVLLIGHHIDRHHGRETITDPFVELVSLQDPDVLIANSVVEDIVAVAADEADPRIRDVAVVSGPGMAAPNDADADDGGDQLSFASTFLPVSPTTVVELVRGEPACHYTSQVDTTDYAITALAANDRWVAFAQEGRVHVFHRGAGDAPARTLELTELYAVDRRGHRADPPKVEVIAVDTDLLAIGIFGGRSGGGVLLVNLGEPDMLPVPILEQQLCQVTDLYFSNGDLFAAGGAYAGRKRLARIFRIGTPHDLLIEECDMIVERESLAMRAVVSFEMDGRTYVVGCTSDAHVCVCYLDDDASGGGR